MRTLLIINDPPYGTERVRYAEPFKARSPLLLDDPTAIRKVRFDICNVLP